MLIRVNTAKIKLNLSMNAFIPIGRVEVEGTNVLNMTADELQEFISTEVSNTHPAHIAVLHLSIAQYQGHDRNVRLQHMQKALHLMEQNKEKLSEETAWQEKRCQLMALFNRSFALILNDSLNLITEKNVMTVLALISMNCSEQRMLQEIDIPDDDRINIAKVFCFMHFILGDIHTIHDSLKRLTDYYSAKHFNESNLTISLMNVLLSSVWGSLDSYFMLFPDTFKLAAQNVKYDVLQSVQDATDFLKSIKSDDCIKIRICLLPCLITLTHRLVQIRLKDTYEMVQVFSYFLDDVIVQSLISHDSSRNNNIWYQQFYLDRMNAFYIIRNNKFVGAGSIFHDQSFVLGMQKSHQRISRLLTNVITSNWDVVLHILTAWHGIVSIQNLIFNSYCGSYANKLIGMSYQVHDLLQNSKTDHNSFARALVHNHPLVVKQLVKNMQHVELQFSQSVPQFDNHPATKRKLIQEINILLQQVLYSVNVLKNSSALKKAIDSESKIFLWELLPIPRVDYIMIVIFNLLPSAQEFRQSYNDWPIYQKYLASEKWQKDLTMLHYCYSSMKEAMIFFSARPEWFMGGKAMTDYANFFIEEYIDPKIQTVLQELKAFKPELLDQDAIDRGLYVGQRLIAEERANNEKKKEKRKLKVRSNKKDHLEYYRENTQKTIITQNDFQNENDFPCHTCTPTLHEKASAIFQDAMKLYSRGKYHKAREKYVTMGLLHGDYKLRSQEGVFSCHVQLVIKQLLQLRRQLDASSAFKKIHMAHAKACHLEVDRLQNECNLLFREYQELECEMKKVSEMANIKFLADARHELHMMWDSVSRAQQNLIHKMDTSRYEKIMSLGFAAHQIKDLQKQQELYDLGVDEHVHKIGKTRKHKMSKLDKQFQGVFASGLAAFHALGEDNYEKYGTSPYQFLREVLENLDAISEYAQNVAALGDDALVDEVLISTGGSSSSSAASLSHQTPAIKIVPLVEPTVTSMSTATNVGSNHVAMTKTTFPTQTISTAATQSVQAEPTLSTNTTAMMVLQYLCDTQMLYDKDLLSKWAQSNTQTLPALIEKGLIDCELLYECFSAWVLNPDLKARIAFLNETGLLRWLLSLDGSGPLIAAKKGNVVNQRLDKIAKSLSKIPQGNWNTHLILAQVLAALLITAFDRKALVDQLQHFGLKERPLRRICDTLELSLACQSALHAYLVTYVRIDYKPEAYPNETIQTLDEEVQKYNRDLITKGNIQDAPADAVIYGSYAYIHLIPETTHKPADIDVRTNLSIHKWKIIAVLHPHLGEQQVYIPLLEGGKKSELALSIKHGDGSLMEWSNTLDFTLSQVVYHLGLRSVMYCTQAAYDDLMQQKVLRFVHPKEVLFENMKVLLLRPLIAGNNTGLYLDDASAKLVNEFMYLERQAAYTRNSAFLEPLLEPGVLLHFLFTYCVYRSSLQYVTLAYHYNILPLLFPIPIAALPMNEIVLNDLKAALQQFDNERAQNSNQDGWDLVAKCIAIVLDKIMALLPGYKTLMPAALKMLPEFLPDNPDLWSAVQHYVSVYANQRTSSVVSLSSQSVLSHHAPLQVRIGSTSHERTLDPAPKTT